jgi:cytochrome oxidase assembly protein ShyY1
MNGRRPDAGRLDSSRLGFGLFTLAMVAAFVALGLWQLQRRVEKHALIAALTERLAAAPVSLPPPAQWQALTPMADEFRRVIFSATYAKPDAMVYASGSAIREDLSGPGTWAFLPARLPSGETVVVNTGFVENTMQDRAVEDRAVARLVDNKPVTLTGYLRFPESGGLFTPAANIGKRLWFARDVPDMAWQLGWGKGENRQGEHRPAPFYIDLESPVPPNGIPKPGPLHVHLKDDHMQYAVTWFSLASALIIAFGVWWRRKA